jgi:TonB family protein
MGRADIVRLLLEAGADVGRRDNLGLTAIDWAQRKGFSDVTQLLLRSSTTTRPASGFPSKQNKEDQEFRDSDFGGNKKVTDESDARKTAPGSERRVDVGFGPAAIAMLKAKERQSNREAAVIRSEPGKENISPEPLKDASSSWDNASPKLVKENIAHKPLKENASGDASLWWTESLGGEVAHDASSTEPETLRARMETERIFEEARVRVEQEVRKKTQEQVGSIIDKDPFEGESSPARKTASGSTTLKRCPKCNTIYDDDFRLYCAYDAGRLVIVDPSVERASTSAFGRPTLWLLVAVTLVGSVVITYLATSYLNRQEVTSPAPAAATEKTPTEENSPVVGGALVGKELNLPKAEYPANARSAGTSDTVTVVVRVTRNGRVTSARALNGDKQLRAAAVKAARKATFSPEKLVGDERNVAGTITYTFKP